MKKILVASILGLATVASVQAQGQVQLYNYSQPATRINYGTGSGGPNGTGLVQGTGGTWTVGLYYAAQTTTSAATVNAAMAGDGGFGLIPLLSLDELTVGLITGYPGLFGTSGAESIATLTGVPAAATLVVVAYNGATYASSSVRGHSAAFELATTQNPATPADVGTAMTSFSVLAVPEPSTFALAGLGLAGLLIFRRRK